MEASTLTAFSLTKKAHFVSFIDLNWFDQCCRSWRYRHSLAKILLGKID